METSDAKLAREYPEAKTFFDAIALTYDDTPKLVFADWLDEHECPARAEYIRLSIAEETYKATPKPGVRQKREHESRCARLAELWRDYQDIWFKDTTSRSGDEFELKSEGSNFWCLTRKGFCSHITADLQNNTRALQASDLPKITEAFALAPGVHEASLSAHPDLCVPLAEHDCMRNIRSLTMTLGEEYATRRGDALMSSHEDQRQALGALLTGKGLCNLEYLSFYSTLEISELAETLEQNAQAIRSRIKPLGRIHFSCMNEDNDCPVESVRRLVKALETVGLEKLDFEYYHLCDDGATVLLASEAAKNLTDLSLVDGWISAETVHALIRSPLAQQLRYLDIKSNPDIGEEGIRALTKAIREKKLPQLQKVWAEDTGASEQALIALERALANNRKRQVG